MHVDESDDPGARTLHAFAVAAIKAGWHGRVTADHATALAAYDDNYAARVMSLVARARMNVVVLPTKLMRGGVRDKEPAPPGHHAREGAARRGRERRLWPGRHPGRVPPGVRHRRPASGGVPARVRGPVLVAGQHRDALRHGHGERGPDHAAADYGLEVGRRADLVVVDAPSVHEAYRTQPARLAVVHDGRVVARNGRIVGD